MSKRPASAPDTPTADEKAAKVQRLNQAINDALDTFVCPITHELPLDPVTAEDGRIYERAAIANWIKQKGKSVVKSPITNEPMGRKLMPSPQVRDVIKTMITQEMITGDKVEAWRQRLAEEEEMAKERNCFDDLLRNF